MSVNILGQLRQAAAKLNPSDVRQAAERRPAVLLRARSEMAYDAMFRFLLPASLSELKRQRITECIFLEGETPKPERFDVTLVEHGVPAGPGEFVYSREREDKLVREVLDQDESVGLPLARCFPAFRPEVVSRTIQTIAVENAVFSVATALPNIAPYLGLVWTPGEFASDTAFLTLNQIRMLFLLGGASDRAVGYAEQKSEIASLVAGAFGWRAVARELAGKIPLGGGLIPKAAIAFAGTWVAGSSVERLYRVGYGFTRAERSSAYGDAFERGQKVAAAVIDKWRNR